MNTALAQRKAKMLASVASSANDTLRTSTGMCSNPRAGSVASRAGVFTSSKKANGFGKGDKSACERAFLSALLSFQDRALKEGGDAVVKLTSYYRKNSFSRGTEYECGTGALMVGVALQGEVVKLKK